MHAARTLIQRYVVEQTHTLEERLKTITIYLEQGNQIKNSVYIPTYIFEKKPLQAFGGDKNTNPVLQRTVPAPRTVADKKTRRLGSFMRKRHHLG